MRDGAQALTGLGLARLALGEPAAGIAPLALRAGGPPRELAYTRFALARVLQAARRDRARALALAEDARAACAAVGPAAATELAAVDAWLAANPR